MSAFLSIRYADKVQLITDGSAYDPVTGTLFAVVEKVWRASSVPVAITGRGNWRAVKLAASSIVAAGDELGSVDRLLDALPRLSRMRDRGSAEDFDLLIAGWSETRGPVHFSFSTHDRNGGFPPFELLPMDDIALGGPSLSHDDVNAFATVPITDPQFLERHGADVMELMRRDFGPLSLLHSESGNGFAIGGHCQLTTIAKDGAETRTLRTWSDPVGETINPFSSDGRIVPLINRKQRRAMKADRRRMTA